MSHSVRTIVVTLLSLGVFASASAQDEAPDFEALLRTAETQLDRVQQNLARSAYGLELMESKEALFADAILPILENRCFKCHGEDKQKGGLRLDSRASLLDGGETDLAVVPGDADESLLVRAIRHTEKLKMPKKEKLPQGEIDLLTAWVSIGVPWPEGASVPVEATPTAEATVSIAVKDVPAVLLAVDEGAPLSFNRDIRPIFSDHCYACHGPDEKTRKAGLRLDFEENAFGELPSGRRAIVAGDLAQSQVVQRLAAHDPDDMMPPSDFTKPVTQEQVNTIARWILQGAKWETHWAFVPPERIEPSGTQANPLDRFVQARLENSGLHQNESADKRTLIRRATFDLTGLPPTPDEITAFLNDERPDAFEHLLDRLLASPSYGEHMARGWLDAARYADTNGYHIDNERHMWRWRDWVIDAFNTNKPFDEFTIEQLAGDLLENPTQDQLIATGFNRNHMINFEGGAIPEEYRVQYVVDRVSTTSTVWLGLTMACAQCHDHKYDPISQKEFYEMFAFFNTVDEIGLDGNATGNARPVIQAPLQRQRERLATLNAKISETKNELFKPDKKLDKAYKSWKSDWRKALSKRWNPLRPESAIAENGSTLTIQKDDSVLATGETPEVDTYVVELALPAGDFTAIQLEAIPDESHNNKIGRASNGNFILTEFDAEVAQADTPDVFETVTFQRAMVDIEQGEFPIANANDDNLTTGWAPNGHGQAGNRLAVFVPSKRIDVGDGGTLRVKLAQRHEGHAGHLVGRFRVAVTEDPALGLVTRNPWYVSGPYRAESKDDAERRSYIDVATIDPEATYADGRSQWNRIIPDVNEESPRDIEGGLGATYLYRNLESPVARTLDVRIGATESMTVWVNGEQVVVANDRKALRKNEVDIKLPLSAGRNDVVVRLVSFDKKAQFFFDVKMEPIDVLDYQIVATLSKDEESWSPFQQESLLREFRSKNWYGWDEVSERLAKLEMEQKELDNSIPISMVMGEMAEPRKTFILDRGQYDQPRAEVTANTPAFLSRLPEDLPKNRLGLAKWLVSEENPLTARVTVNRIWARLFGRGLVATVEDFGSQGQWPTHPELLDWLARDFVESGWDLKKLQRDIMTSATYRQTSKARPDEFKTDPDNLLLARAPRVRFDAEVVRDNALAISGLLNSDDGGKSVLPYQPPGLWQEVGYGGNFTAQIFKQDEGENLYRRSMYTFWKRTAPPPSMMIFDAPNRETCTVARGRSNTSLQALTLMNDPQFVEASRKFAERIMKEGGETVESRLTTAFEIATARIPSKGELQILSDLYETQLTTFSEEESHAELLAVGDSPYDTTLDTRELAAWSVVASILLNMDETITRN